MAEPLAEQMLKWNIEICARECAKTGGCALDAVEPETPASALLHTIEVPIAVAYGTYDETYTKVAMKHVGSKVPTPTVREFQAAHMINMELPDDFNQWLGKWLEGFLEE
jgi:pimeloyl-ACP methyl ester carboxylesterase